MATLSPTITLKDPKLGHGGSGIHPPTVDGGGDGRDDNGFSDYGARLRRARLCTIIALVAVVMIFLALTSAYVVLRGLPVMDRRRRICLSHQRQQFVCIFAYGDPRSSPSRRRAGVAVRRHHVADTQASRSASHCGGRDGVVLALHGTVVDLYFRFAGVCAIAATRN